MIKMEEKGLSHDLVYVSQEMLLHDGKRWRLWGQNVWFAIPAHRFTTYVNLNKFNFFLLYFTIISK